MYAIRSVNRKLIGNFVPIQLKNSSKKLTTVTNLFSSHQIASNKLGDSITFRSNQIVLQPVASSTFYKNKNRNYSTGDDRKNSPENDNYQPMPKFSDEQTQVAPTLLGFIRNLLTTWKIRNKFDKEFSVKEFNEGSKQAVEVVSRKLSNGDFDGLRNLVESSTLDKIEAICKDLNVQQRQDLQINPKDIVKSFVHNIEFVGDSTVEIFMVYHVMKGYNDFEEGKISPEQYIGNKHKFLDDNLYLLNYKFIKDFSSSNDDWTINMINQTRMVDEMMSQQKQLRQLFQKLKEEKEENEKKK